MFLSLHSCEGIWECLSSQQVVDFVRLKVSEGKELNEIGKMICDHCLAPDMDPPPHDCDYVGCSDPCGTRGIGCDNMTVVIVAILSGRTKEDWYTWVTDRVKQKYGYETPSSAPQIYAQNRLAAFKARREEQEEWERRRAEQEESGTK
jgi:protein phosphatase PTC2/3